MELLFGELSAVTAEAANTNAPLSDTPKAASHIGNDLLASSYPGTQTRSKAYAPVSIMLLKRGEPARSHNSAFNTVLHYHHLLT